MPRRKPPSLDPVVVINAYAQGIFPMADDDGTIYWYAPDPRDILEYDNLHVSRSLRATIRKGIYEIRMDTVFGAVMRYCAAREGTWISQAFGFFAKSILVIASRNASWTISRASSFESECFQAARRTSGRNTRR